MVLLFHLDRLEGGFLGVDAFFVVSGWLITWKMLNQADRDGRIHLRRFWVARLRRIIPAAMVVLLTVAAVWPIVGIEVASLRRDLFWAAGWVSNWGTVSGGGDYWARFGDPSPVTHFWSLAIEEQFYLVWPIAVAAVVALSRSHRRNAALVAVLGAVGSIAVMNLTFDPVDVTATYMNTFARAHSLLIGAAAAAFTTVLPHGGLRGGSTARRLAPVGLAIAVAVMAFASDRSDWMFVWGFPVFAGCVMIVVVAAADGLGETLLASTPLRWLGDRSYGLYLWHWPIFLLLSPERVGASDAVHSMLALDATRVTVAVVVADLSFRFVESPIRRRRRLVDWRASLAAVGATSALVAIGVAMVPVVTTSESSSVTLPPPPPPTTAFTTPTLPGSTVPRSTVPDDAGEDGVSSPATTIVASTAVAAPTTVALPTTPLRVLVAGDSTGVQLAESLTSFAERVPDQLVVGSATFNGCGLTAGSDGRLHEFTTEQGDRDFVDLRGCHQMWESMPQRVRDEFIDAVVVNIGPWDSVDIHLDDDVVVSVADPQGQQLITDAYERFVRQISDAGATVVWVVPADSRLGWGNVDDPLNDPERWDALRAIIGELDVVSVDFDGWLTASGLDGPEGRPDGVHLALPTRERFVTELLAPSLEAERIRLAQG